MWIGNQGRREEEPEPQGQGRSRPSGDPAGVKQMRRFIWSWGGSLLHSFIHSAKTYASADIEDLVSVLRLYKLRSLAIRVM